MSGPIGASQPRAEDHRLLTGTGVFGDDVAEDGAHVVFVRSTRAHATLRRVDVSGTRTMPGVLAAFTFADLPASLRADLPVLFPHSGLTEPRCPAPLAEREVCHVGQPVAVVVATDRYLAEDAAEEVVVDYADLPVAADLDGAARGDAVAHADMTDNVAGVVAESVGDFAGAWQSAPHRFEWTFSVERSAGMPVEPRVVSARFGGGRLEVRDTTQSPVSIRDGLAALLGLDPFDVRVVAGDIGGSFGSKGLYFYPEEVLVPWLAMRLGTPVKWTEDRAEHFVASAHERGQTHRVLVGADRDGTIRALRTEFTHDMGAFARYGLIVPVVTASQLPGMYRLPHYSYELRAVYTNTVPVAPYRGAGRAHGAFVMERVLQRVARELHLDPVLVRRRNLLRPDEFPYPVGVTYQDGERVVYDSGNYPVLFDRLDETVDLAGVRRWCANARARGRQVGLGVAGYVEGTGLGPYEFAMVRVAGDGVLEVSVASSHQGQGHETVLAQIVAAEFGLAPDRVRAYTGDTARVPYGTGTYASRGAVMSGNAAGKAARSVRRRTTRLAARVLAVDESTVEWAGGRFFAAGEPDDAVTLADLAAVADPAGFAVGPDAGRVAALRARAHAGTGGAVPAGEAPALTATESFSSARGAWGSGVHAAVVEVDPDTFAIRVLRYVVVHDCGVVINPAIVAGQVLGGVVQGIGGALYERFRFAEDGTLTNADLHGFLVPTAADLPEIEIHHLGVPATTNPLGVKGVGEAGVIPVGAAIANAIEDATGIAVDHLPVFPEQLAELAHSDRATGLVRSVS